MFVSDLIAGDTLNRTWQFLQSNGDPVDLTGSSAIFGMATLPSGNSFLQAATTDTNPSLTIPTPSNGTILLNLPPSETLPLPPGLYVIAIKILFPTGQKFTYDTENVRVTRPIANG